MLACISIYFFHQSAIEDLVPCFLLRVHKFGKLFYISEFVHVFSYFWRIYSRNVSLSTLSAPSGVTHHGASVHGETVCFTDLNLFWKQVSKKRNNNFSQKELILPVVLWYLFYQTPGVPCTVFVVPEIAKVGHRSFSLLSKVHKYGFGDFLCCAFLVILISLFIVLFVTELLLNCYVFRLKDLFFVLVLFHYVCMQVVRIGNLFWSQKSWCSVWWGRCWWRWC